MNFSKKKCIRTVAKQRNRLSWWLLLLSGFLALIWFLIRVIPKPSRAFYPCQRVAGPLASGFVAWIVGTLASAVAIRKAKYFVIQSHYVLGAICIAIGMAAAIVTISSGQNDFALADSPLPNDRAAHGLVAPGRRRSGRRDRRRNQPVIRPRRR